MYCAHNTTLSEKENLTKTAPAQKTKRNEWLTQKDSAVPLYTHMLQTSLAKPETIGAISRDIGQVFFASLFVGQLIENTINFKIITVGLVLAFVFWFCSILLAKE